MKIYNDAKRPSMKDITIISAESAKGLKQSDCTGNGEKIYQTWKLDGEKKGEVKEIKKASKANDQENCN